MKFYRELGWEACRTAGSKGLIDVVAWQPMGPVHLIQVKRCGRNGNAWRDKNWVQLTNGRGPRRTLLYGGVASPSPVRVYAFVFRHGKSAPEIFDSTGACEWVP